MSWTAPKTWAVGEVVTATNMNTHLRDNLKAIGDPWTSYTPTWTAATTNPTLGNGTLTGAYLSAGKLTVFRVRLTIGSTTTIGSGSYAFALPATANTIGNEPVGNGFIRDNSAATFRMRHAYMNTTGTVRLSDEGGAHVSDTVPWTWASADTLNLWGMYEAA